MIIYKPWRFCLDKDDDMIISEYVGYWLFGIIPLFLRKISKTYYFQDGKEVKMEDGISIHIH